MSLATWLNTLIHLNNQNDPQVMVMFSLGRAKLLLFSEIKIHKNFLLYNCLQDKFAKFSWFENLLFYSAICQMFFLVHTFTKLFVFYLSRTLIDGFICNGLYLWNFHGSKIYFFYSAICQMFFFGPHLYEIICLLSVQDFDRWIHM